jgi:phosphate-selective porin OprO/OprP
MHQSLPARLAGAALLAVSYSVAAQEPVTNTIPVQTLAEPAKPEVREIGFKVKTRGGFSIESDDGSAGFDIEGRTVFDVNYFDGFYNQGGDGATGSESELRRARFGFNGWYSKDWNYTFLVNLAEDTRSIDETATTIDTAMVQYTGFKYADVTVGRFKRPVSLDILTSSNWQPLTELAYIWELAPANDITKFSLQASKLFEFGNKSGLVYQLALSDAYAEDEPTKSGKDHYALNGRLVYTPWVDKGRVLHLGLSYGDQNPGDGATTNVRSRLGVHGISKLTLAASQPIDSDSQYGLEAAGIFGPMSFQAEYLSRSIGGAEGSGDIDVSGYYLTGTYTLTGESRGYKRKDGRFDKIVPANHRFGAIELVARIQSATVSPQGGTEVSADAYTVGANWYPIRAVKLALDVTQATVDGLDTGAAGDSGRAVVGRVQWVF